MLSHIYARGITSENDTRSGAVITKNTQGLRTASASVDPSQAIKIVGGAADVNIALVRRSILLMGRAFCKPSGQSHSSWQLHEEQCGHVQVCRDHCTCGTCKCGSQCKEKKAQSRAVGLRFVVHRMKYMPDCTCVRVFAITTVLLQSSTLPIKPCFKSRLWPVPDFIISAPPANSHISTLYMHIKESAHQGVWPHST